MTNKSTDKIKKYKGFEMKWFAKTTQVQVVFGERTWTFQSYAMAKREINSRVK
jgi:hypothetical protein